LFLIKCKQKRGVTYLRRLLFLASDAKMPAKQRIEKIIKALFIALISLRVVRQDLFLPGPLVQGKEHKGYRHAEGLAYVSHGAEHPGCISELSLLYGTHYGVGVRRGKE